jgi:hypothetical protein
MNPDLKRKIGILRHIRFEIKSFFLEPESGLRGRDLDETIKMRRMAHCRVLCGFFTKKQRGDDDVLATDFDFPCCEWNDLYPGDGDAYKVKQCFNKRLFHLTYSRLQVSDEKWCIELAFPPIEAKAREFIKHIVNVLSKNELTSKNTGSIKAEELPELQALEANELVEWKHLETEIMGVIRRPLQTNTKNV